MPLKEKESNYGTAHRRRLWGGGFVLLKVLRFRECGRKTYFKGQFSSRARWSADERFDLLFVRVCTCKCLVRRTHLSMRYSQIICPCICSFLTLSFRRRSLDWYTKTVSHQPLRAIRNTLLPGVRYTRLRAAERDKRRNSIKEFRRGSGEIYRRAPKRESRIQDDKKKNFWKKPVRNHWNVTGVNAFFCCFCFRNIVYSFVLLP